MRKGLLLTACVLLAVSSIARAQDRSISPPDTFLPSVTPGVAKQAAVPKASLLPPEVVAAFTPQSDEPLRFWASADYLLWWIKSGPLSSPIITTTNNLKDAPPAALGQGGTTVLLGDQPMGYGAFSGLRIGAGFEIAPCLNLEGGFFFLERRTFKFNAVSDAAGSPVIANPFFNTAIGIEDALLNSDPDTAVGPWRGGTLVQSHTRLQGWEVNLAGGDYCAGSVKLKGIVGFRALSLAEDLSVDNFYTPLVNGALTFLANPVNAGTQLQDTDRFATTNNFYGGQIGGKAQWQNGRYSVDGLFKIAFGVNQQIATVDGFSVMTVPGAAPVGVRGGTYTQLTNIGRYYRNEFAVVPEVGFNLGWNITDRLKFTIGYSFLYISSVARPGDQIDHSVNQFLIPTHQNFGQGTPDSHPAFAFRESSFWAQGINFGLEFRY
jgi:hypothetical protein